MLSKRVLVALPQAVMLRCPKRCIASRVTYLHREVLQGVNINTRHQQTLLDMSASLWLWRHVSPGFPPAARDPNWRAHHFSPRLAKQCQNIVRMPKLRALRQGGPLGVHIHLERDRLRPLGCTYMTFPGKHLVDEVEAVLFARFHHSSSLRFLHVSAVHLR